MSYIGNTATTQAFTPAVDYFSGNGSTTAFTLSRPVASVAQVEAVIDNVVQNPSSAYTVSSNTITFTSAPLSGTNNIYVRYTSPITQVIAPSAGTVGSSQLASLTTLPTSGGNITIPASTGTMMVSGNMPTFYAYKIDGNQTVSSATFTKITLTTEGWDTNNNFASSRFTPTVAGYYQLNGSFSVEGAGTVTRFIISIYKNGAEYIRGIDSVTTGNSVIISAMIPMNGTTDYVELYGWISGAGAIAFRGGSDGNFYTYFQGCLLRAS